MAPRGRGATPFHRGSHSEGKVWSLYVHVRSQSESNNVFLRMRLNFFKIVNKCQQGAWPQTPSWRFLAGSALVLLTVRARWVSETETSGCTIHSMIHVGLPWRILAVDAVVVCSNLVVSRPTGDSNCETIHRLQRQTPRRLMTSSPWRHTQTHCPLGYNLYRWLYIMSSNSSDRDTQPGSQVVSNNVTANVQSSEFGRLWLAGSIFIYVSVVLF